MKGCQGQARVSSGARADGVGLARVRTSLKLLLVRDGWWRALRLLLVEELLEEGEGREGREGEEEEEREGGTPGSSRGTNQSGRVRMTDW